MAGGTGPGNGIVDHLSGENQRCRDRHGGQFLLLIILSQLMDGDSGGCAGCHVHGGCYCWSQQGVCHMH